MSPTFNHTWSSSTSGLVRALNIVLEISRIFDIFTFSRPPPEYSFRSLEPLFVSSIAHYQQRLEGKYREINANAEKTTSEDAEHKPIEIEGHFDEMEEMLSRYSRLVNNLESMLSRPHLRLKKHSDFDTDVPELDTLFGPERYIVQPNLGYGFSNDYIRQWLAAFPGPLGRHFEKENASTVNLTQIAGQISIAIAGGAALLVPMIIMTFLQGREARLIIVSVATIIFGVFLGIFSSSKEAVLGGTAAYAAIMVVYIGSASPAVSSG